MNDDELLKEIRDDFSFFRDFWRENYEEAKTDLRYVAGDPWDTSERRAREDNGRPVVSPDELGQYLNATINNLRQNPLSIKIEPKGEGATDANAEQRQALIRNIEYDSVAQAAYTNAYSSAINCGFGFFRVTTKRSRKGSDDVEPRIKIIGNPLSVMMDPNAKEADWSDAKKCFVMDVMRQSDFKRMYPKAQKTSFSVEDTQVAPDWFEAQNVVVAEYWRIDGYDEDGEGGKVTQYVTNGVEILSETPWPGSRIPIIPVVGKEVYVPNGGKMSRMYYSMVRMARGPQMLYAYIVSQEAEEYGMTPRSPFVGYVGQFDTDKDAWATANKVPTAYLQIDPMVDQTSSVLPLPSRPQFTPNAQAYEIGKESARRMIQAAMGITPLPTAAQRMNDKSGVALDRINTQQSVGSYHFTANFKLSLQNAGFQINELITKILDTPRQMAGREQDGEASMIHITPGGQGQPPPPQQPPTQLGMPAPPAVAPPQMLDPKQGEYDVTISTGPSFQSQRETANEFADTLLSEMNELPLAPPQKAKLLALAIKLKDIGPLGDEMADIVDPQQDSQIPPQAQAQIAHLTQELQKQQQMGQQLYAEYQKVDFQNKAHVVDNQAKIQLEKMRIEASITTAEINTKAQAQNERDEFVHDMLVQLVKQKHDGVMKAADLAHEAGLAGMSNAHQSAQLDQQAANASAQSSQDASQQQAMQPEPDDSSEDVQQ